MTKITGSSHYLFWQPKPGYSVNYQKRPRKVAAFTILKGGTSEIIQFILSNVADTFLIH